MVAMKFADVPGRDALKKSSITTNRGAPIRTPRVIVSAAAAGVWSCHVIGPGHHAIHAVRRPRCYGPWRRRCRRERARQQSVATYASYVGDRPTTPRYAAGRMIEPPVCVATLSGTIRSATTTAEPLEEPLAVRSRFQGLRAREGSRPANCVVSTLPRTIAPAERSRAMHVASTPGSRSSERRKICSRRQAAREDEIFHADRNAAQ